jgi:hypothetical protein
VAVHLRDKKLIIAEIEGESTGQPEQKVAKAIGQIVSALNETECSGFSKEFVIVVQGEKLRNHLERAKALVSLGVSGLSIGEPPEPDEWLFRRAGLGMSL